MKLSTGLDGRDAGLVGDIGERTVAVVVVQDIAAVLGDVEIGETVVVVVPPDATEAVACPGNASLIRDISKDAVAVVAIKRVACGDAAVVEIAPIDEIDVLEAVTVEICHTDAGAEYLRDNRHAVLPL